MTQPPKFDESANSQPKPTELPTPKRGAIPTPKAEIERAKPYVIEADGAAENKSSSLEDSTSR